MGDRTYQGHRMIKVNCVIVTCNRLSLLKECITAVLSQTFLIYKIIIVNNASTDGTSDYLKTLDRQRFEIITCRKNTGGAGGFNEGMKKSCEIGADWTWVMDDDTIPFQNALELLVIKSGIIKNTGFLCSRVLWGGGGVI
jgi:GT2 family glycosyltransferase